MKSTSVPHNLVGGIRVAARCHGPIKYSSIGAGGTRVSLSTGNLAMTRKQEANNATTTTTTIVARNKKTAGEIRNRESCF